MDGMWVGKRVVGFPFWGVNGVHNFDALENTFRDLSVQAKLSEPGSQL